MLNSTAGGHAYGAQRDPESFGSRLTPPCRTGPISKCTTQ
ncbi:unnamed protein product [Protopolystoma xenopodis]|uniref:Uncharacterized protein n=1 Tax=Protopolystoma xenopodis TaxID=117903 RepID=A0A3S5CD10_9PLAT|nr:unnamed protein product [Protopolystoma xenopodis]